MNGRLTKPPTKIFIDASTISSLALHLQANTVHALQKTEYKYTQELLLDIEIKQIPKCYIMLNSAILYIFNEY